MGLKHQGWVRETPHVAVASQPDVALGVELGPNSVGVWMVLIAEQLLLGVGGEPRLEFFPLTSSGRLYLQRTEPGRDRLIDESGQVRIVVS